MAKHRKTNLLRESIRSLPSRAEVDWFRERILAWAAENGRDFPWRQTNDEYRIVVTEILLQQTNASAVAKLYDTFFKALPTWEALHLVPEDQLQKLITGIGLYRQRTRRLKALATWVAENGGHLPATRDKLEDVPGIGQYVASVLLAVKYAEPEPMLDVNMARVLERFFGERELADIRDDPWLQALARMAVSGGAAGFAVLDFAAAVCRAQQAACSGCFLRERCLHGGRRRKPSEAAVRGSRI